MNGVTYFPIDFDSLAKGDVIAPERVEEFSSCKRGSDKFRLALLVLRERVVRELRERDKHYTVAIIKGQLRILTDEEAAIYNSRTFKHGFRRAVRSHRRLAHVDTAGFNELQKSDHERNLLVQGRMLQAARSALQSLVAVAHKRTVPGLLSQPAHHQSSDSPHSATEPQTPVA